MAELDPLLGGEAGNSLILEALPMLEEGLRVDIKNLFQSKCFLGEDTPRTKLAQAQAFSQRRPLLLEVMANPEETPERKVRASQEFQAGEQLMRELFP